MPSVASAEPNVQLAAVCGFVAHIILQICKAHGIIIDDETASGLPAFLVLVGAYVPDVIGKYRSQKSISDKQLIAV